MDSNGQKRERKESALYGSFYCSLNLTLSTPYLLPFSLSQRLDFFSHTNCDKGLISLKICNRKSEGEEEKISIKTVNFEEKVRAVIGINAVHLPLHFTPALFSHDFYDLPFFH